MYVPQKINDEMKLVIDVENKFFVYIDKCFYPKEESDHIFQELEKQVEYNVGSFFEIYGKKIPIPRKQTAYGDPGTSYSFTNQITKAKPWIPIIQKIREDVEYFTGKTFN